MARLIFFRGPLVSSKVKHLSMRGSLGNGLRVVAGTVFASGGQLRVFTRGDLLGSPHRNPPTARSSPRRRAGHLERAAWQNP